ncbi:hydroxyisourate hydrolase [Corynebacterium glyciniphilum]|uniref:hydroxyisourate hydrolase n=1 Tax=Corynebacterium glyciniphilum TaxID=1404244 RepID=UPI00264D73CE|nr:hydroxyisourate hydrolase [Corynebacterium glyciniphilum]MDN5682667.1 hydroxyisourate hydrolase [Corynebacterium glyciniphilum]MDN6705012.1 hydroxyisourate hydrolase [Corynebacterium glyciniphilum]
MSLSTHVLNTATGVPAVGLTVDLYAGQSTLLESGATDADGRHRFVAQLVPGAYRLRFDTGAYLADAATSSLYPHVDVTFHVTAERGGADGHLHVPLLLSPFGYSTYQGS